MSAQIFSSFPSLFYDRVIVSLWCIDGSGTATEIAEHMGDRALTRDVFFALFYLESHGYVTREIHVDKCLWKLA